MGISRDSRHKRRLTGGRMPIHKKKRKFESGRPNANTKLAARKIRLVRTRGGNRKFRALALNSGNFNWSSLAVTRKTNLVDTIYNASNNELVRTKTLVKNSIISIDATPFVNWLNEHFYGIHGESLDAAKLNLDFENKEDYKDKDVQDKYLKRRLTGYVEPSIQSQLKKGTLLACVSSRPGQSGRCDGYILEGHELEFYTKKMMKKKNK